MIEFVGDDSGYRNWLDSNPDGFVLNVRRVADPSHVVLHRSDCGYISTKKREFSEYTANNFRKICASSVAELQSAAKKEGRGDGTFSKKCSKCLP